MTTKTTARNARPIVSLSPVFRSLALLNAGKIGEAADCLVPHVKANPGDHAAWRQLAVAEGRRGRFLAALDAIDHALQLMPGKPIYLRLKGALFADAGQFADAIAVLLPLVQARPGDVTSQRALQQAYYRGGKPSHALALGRRLLKEADQKAPTGSAAAPGVDFLSLARGPKRVVCFALLDGNPLSALGAIANARLVKEHYPGWGSRFYLKRGVLPDTVTALRRMGAELRDGAADHPAVPPPFWPFLAADDPGVAAFLFRDVHQRISAKESAAVDAWLNSGKRAHVMRDHVLHADLLPTGLWGALTEPSLFVSARIERFMAAQGNAPQEPVQRFLDSEIWPAIRDDCLVHDSHYNLFNAQPFPVMGKGDEQFHLGMHVTKAEALRREAQSLGLAWPPV